MKLLKSSRTGFRNQGILLTLLLPLGFLFTGCMDENIQTPDMDESRIVRINADQAGDILRLGQITDAEVTVRSHGPGYHALAKGSGFIPGGEYAGHRFRVTITGEYSGLGPEGLVAGTAEVRIRSEKFESVMSVDLNSFCCGEGYILDLGTHYEFTVFGQVEHTTGSPVHNHLFAGLGSTLGTMNMNIADQTGTITEPPAGGPPPHDPGIGLIEGIPARPVRVEEIP